MSDNQGLVDFAIELVNSLLNLPDGQAKFFYGSRITEELLSILLVKNFRGLVKMTLRLVRLDTLKKLI